MADAPHLTQRYVIDSHSKATNIVHLKATWFMVIHLVSIGMVILVLEAVVLIQGRKFGKMDANTLLMSLE